MSLLSVVKVIKVVMVITVLIENEKIDQVNKAIGNFALTVAGKEPDDKG